MRWLLAYTKPRSESLAQEQLLRQGYEVLCPLIRVQKRRRRRWSWLEEPLFPRYVFVGAEDEQAWAPVRSTLGVTSLVKFGLQYATVSADLIALLQQGNQDSLPHRPVFLQGQKVRIIAGPYASLDAIFEMSEGDERATVLLDLLGRQNRIEVAWEQLVPEG